MAYIFNFEQTYSIASIRMRHFCSNYRQNTPFAPSVGGTSPRRSRADWLETVCVYSDKKPTHACPQQCQGQWLRGNGSADQCAFNIY